MLKGYNAALRAFKIIGLNHALPCIDEVKPMVESILAAKREGKLMGMSNGFDNYLAHLCNQGFDVAPEGQACNCNSCVSLRYETMGEMRGCNA